MLTWWYVSLCVVFLFLFFITVRARVSPQKIVGVFRLVIDPEQTKRARRGKAFETEKETEGTE